MWSVPTPPNAVPARPQPPSAASVRITQVRAAWPGSPAIRATISVGIAYSAPRGKAVAKEIKSLEANYGHVPGIAAATILGDGRIALILLRM